MKLKREKNAHQPIMNFALKNTQLKTQVTSWEKRLCVCQYMYVHVDQCL